MAADEYLLPVRPLSWSGYSGTVAFGDEDECPFAMEALFRWQGRVR